MMAGAAKRLLQEVIERKFKTLKGRDRQTDREFKDKS